MIGRAGPRVRLAARIVGVMGAVLWLVPLVAGLGTTEANQDVDDDAFWESVGVFVLAIANIGGVALAFFREQVGGGWLLGSGVLFSVFAIVTAGRNHWLAALVSGGPFLAAGVLFLLAAARAP